MLHYRLHRDPRSSHQQIARLLKELNPALSLDVGAAQGILGQILQGSNLTLDAVEANPAWAEQARPFYRTVHACLIEQANLPEGTYDAVVCADVLEHVPDPVAVLNQLKRVAKPGAAFIISLPNITHVAVRTMLLFGYFPKMERGPLDKTHLHFFTRDTAIQMLERAGLQVHRVSSTGVPLDELWKGRESKALFRLMMKSQHLAVRILPRLFGFQWIFVARAEGTSAA